MRRRSAKALKLIAGGAHDPITCYCAGTRFAYAYVDFPLSHTSTCLTCGLVRRCEIKPSPPRPKPPPTHYPPYYY